MPDAHESMKTTFDRDGFVAVPGVLADDHLRLLRDALDRITSNVAEQDEGLRSKILLEREHVSNFPERYEGVITPDECGDSVRTIADIALFDPLFARIICTGALLDMLETLFASSEFSFNLQYALPKPPRVGNGVTFHRDTPFKRFTSGHMIVAILYLDAATEANGATSFIKGSHRISDADAGRPEWKDVKSDRLDREQLVVVPCAAGSAVFFDAKIIHGAGHNRSDGPRRALVTEWLGPDVLPIASGRSAYQGVRPRSRERPFQRQMEMTMAQLVDA